MNFIFSQVRKMVYSRKTRHLVGTPFHPLAILPLSDILSCTINSVSEVFRENALQDSNSRKRFSAKHTFIPAHYS